MSAYRIFASRVPQAQRGPRSPWHVASVEVRAEARAANQVDELPCERSSREREDVAADAEPPAIPMNAEPAVVAMACEYDRPLLQILERDTETGVPIQEAYRRKESELMSAFAILGAPEVGELLDRLTTPRRDDVLATRFGRLAAERRSRLTAALSDPNRIRKLGRV